MATNHDKAAKFAAAITDYLATNKLHTAHDACNYLDSLPAKLHRQPASRQTMHPMLLTHGPIQFMAESCNNAFLPLSDGYSYAERVVRIVWNTYTQTPELWLVPQRFSNTTARHKQMYRNAYMNACRVNNITPVTYTTESASGQGITRAARAIVDREKTIAHCTARMYEATLPRLHESTRYAAIIDAKNTLEYQLRLLTEGVPDPAHMYESLPRLREAHEFTVWELTEEAAFATTMQTLPVKEMRAAIAGLKALDTEIGY